jgi:8-oxo-dGTP diphosphatase
MKSRKAKSRIPILAAGGIVLHNGPIPHFAVVQSSKTDTWGLPKGKLAAGEDAMTAARREVLEETGCRATVHEFLGMLAYEASGRPKIVRFWRMEAESTPVGRLMHDVRAVRWLTLEDAIDQLSYPREQVFLQQVGPLALQFAEAARGASAEACGNIALIAGAGDVFLPVQAAGRLVAAPAEQGPRDLAARLRPALSKQTAEVHVHEPEVERADPIETSLTGETVVKKAMVKRTWGWLRQATLLHRSID